MLHNLKKIVFPKKGFPSQYLPSQLEVAQLLELPTNMSEIILFAEREFEITSGIKKETLRKASNPNIGLGKRSINKLLVFFKKIGFPLKSAFSLKLIKNSFRATNIGSNAGTWFIAAHCFKLPSNNPEFDLMLSFIHQRCETDVNTLTSAKAMKAENMLQKDNLAHGWQIQLPSWQQNSLVPEKALGCMTKLSELIQDNHTFEAQEEMAEAVAFLKLDFYLSLLACYDLGLRARHKQALLNDPSLKPYENILHNLLIQYIELNQTRLESNHKAVIFLSCFLDIIRSLIEDHTGEKLGERQLASFIEINEHKITSETLAEKQYRQLKAWKSGKDKPSTQALEKFFKAMLARIGSNNTYQVMMYARIAKALDTISKPFMNAEKDTALMQQAFLDVLGQYPTYVEHHQKIVDLEYIKKAA